VLRRARATVARLLAVSATLALVVPMGASAHADPRDELAQAKRDIASTQQRLTSLKQDIASTERQLAQLRDRAEAAAERYNDGVLQLAAAKQVSADKQQAAAAAQQRLREIRAQLSLFALQMYKGGDPAALALVDEAQDPQTFVDRAAYSDQLSRQKAATLAAVGTAEHDAQVTADAAGQAVAAQQAVVAGLAADKKQVDDAAQQSQRLLSHLQDKQRELVRALDAAAARAASARRAIAAAARRAAERARERAAELAAESAAAEAAQHIFDGAPTDPSPDSPPVSSGASGNAAAVAVQWAHNELGKPYVWGAAGPSAFDCSGLTMYVYARAGVYLPHSSGAQYGYGRHVSRGELRPGDLVFFGYPIHHVGIYIGGGAMIEAPHTGAVVRISSIGRSDYVGATRVVG
jgi:peptidoglycan DL-endopeptidase CwlO